MSRWLGLGSAAIGALAIVGWALDIGVLKSVLHGQTAMKPNAAVALILLGMALWFSTVARASVARLSSVLALLAVAIGAATLAENAAGRDFGIDQLLFKEAPGAPGTVVPGRMASATAVCVVLLGLALVVVRRERLVVLAHALAPIAGAVSLFELIAVVSGAKGGTVSHPFTLPAINTSAALIALSVGTLLAYANRGLMAVATAGTAGGRLIRRVVPAAAAMLLVVEWTNDLAQTKGLFGGDVGIAFGTTAEAMALVVILWIVAVPLNAREVKQRADEAQLRSILNSAADAILAVDGDGSIVACNPSAEEIFGYAADELNGHSVDELVPEWLEERHPTMRARFMEGALGERMSAEVTGRRKDGSEFPGELTLSKTDVPNGLQVTVIMRDITERKEAERHVVESEARFRTLVEQIPSATLIEVEDPEAPGGFRDEFVSPQIFDLLGYAPEEWMTGEPLWPRIVLPDDRRAAIEASERAVVTGEPYRMEYRAVTRAGDIKWIHEEFTRTGEEGNYRWHGLMTDISDRKRLEVVRREAEAAIRASEMKSEFLSRMSHELRTPLNAILGFAQLLEMDVTDGATRESVGHILRAGKHLLELVDEVLDISHAEPQAPLQAVALGDVADEAAAEIRGQAAERGISVLVTGDGGLRAKADRAAFGRALRDLCSNAVKFNREGGEVEIILSELPENRVRIDVRDTGEGISPDKMGRLFSPFDRLDAENMGIEGTGLGLTLVRALVAGMGGTVSAMSTEGIGSTFSIELDRAEVS